MLTVAHPEQDQGEEETILVKEVKQNTHSFLNSSIPVPKSTLKQQLIHEERLQVLGETLEDQSIPSQVLDLITSPIKSEPIQTFKNSTNQQLLNPMNVSDHPEFKVPFDKLPRRNMEKTLNAIHKQSTATPQNLLKVLSRLPSPTDLPPPPAFLLQKDNKMNEVGDSLLCPFETPTPFSRIRPVMEETTTIFDATESKVSIPISENETEDDQINDSELIEPHKSQSILSKELVFNDSTEEYETNELFSDEQELLNIYNHQEFSNSELYQNIVKNLADLDLGKFNENPEKTLKQALSLEIYLAIRKTIKQLKDKMDKIDIEQEKVRVLQNETDEKMNVVIEISDKQEKLLMDIEKAKLKTADEYNRMSEMKEMLQTIREKEEMLSKTIEQSQYEFQGHVSKSRPVSTLPSITLGFFLALFTLLGLIGCMLYVKEYLGHRIEVINMFDDLDGTIHPY